jgi:hypothetical protein
MGQLAAPKNSWEHTLPARAVNGKKKGRDGAYTARPA